MREIEKTNELHHVLLEIAKTFHLICKKNNIPYYLAGGSMLGAIRHKGFIPWDDDLDIYVPRKYFSKLKGILSTELPHYYKAKDNRDLNVLWGELMKIEDTRTVIYEKLGDSAYEHSVFIDIFPLDYTDNCNSIFSRNWFVRKLLMLEVVAQSPSNNLRSIIIKLITKGMGTHIFTRLIKYIVISHGAYLTNYYGAYGERETFPSEVIGAPTPYPFCDTELYGVEHYHDYLSHLYGDYMKLPPEGERKVHILKMYYKDK